MTHTQTTCLNRIAFHAGKKGALPAEVGALASVFEKSGTELKLKQKLLKCKRTIQIATFNVKTLNRIGQLPELRALMIDHNMDIICRQEHRYTHSEDIEYHDTGNGRTLATASAWKNSVNATIWGVGMLIGPTSLNSIEKIRLRMMIATPAQQSSLATALPMLMKKRNSLPSIMKYPSLFTASRNTMFSSLVQTWMPKLVKNVNLKFSLHNLSNRFLARK